MEAAVRSFAPVEPLALQWQFPLWVPLAGVDTGKLKGRLSQSEKRQAERDREGVGVISEALADGAATARQLRGRTGMTKERLERLLGMMRVAGEVTVVSTIIKGNECNEYRLTKTTK